MITLNACNQQQNNNNKNAISTITEQKPISQPINKSTTNLINGNLFSTPAIRSSDRVKHNPFQTTNQQQTPVSSNVFAALNIYPLHSLHRIGTITIDKHNWVILSLPDGATRAVTIGDKIGRENGVVIGIKANQIEVQLTQKHDGVSNLTQVTL